MRRCPSANPSDRSPLLDAAFRSPAARANLATGSRSRVDVPGLHLRSRPEARPNPFGPRLPLPSGLLFASRARSTPETRCRGLIRFQISFRTSRLFPNRRSPPGYFYPSGSKRSARLHSGNACLYRSPDLPSLPATRKWLIIAARRIIVPDPLLPVKLTDFSGLAASQVAPLG